MNYFRAGNAEAKNKGRNHVEILESESNAMPVFRPWKSDSHFMESNLSSSTTVISACAGIVPQSTKTQNEQFPVRFFSVLKPSPPSQTSVRLKSDRKDKIITDLLLRCPWLPVETQKKVAEAF